jgi:hypothetical protein
LQHKRIRQYLSSGSTLIHVRNGTRAITRALSHLGQFPWRTVSTQADSAGSIPGTNCVRWFLKETGRTRSDPWMTLIVDLDQAHPAGMDEGIHPGDRRTVTHLG